jgi:type II secretory pathway component PulF
MPWYRYIVTESSGLYGRGVRYAGSTDLLIQTFKIEGKKINAIHRTWWSIFKDRRMVASAAWYYHLSSLLKAKIRLHDCLAILAFLPEFLHLRPLILEVQKHVLHGMPLSSVLKHHRTFTSPLIISFIETGERVGDLVTSCFLVAQFLEARETFKQKLLSSLLMPLMSMSLFLAVAALFLIGVVPSFETFLSQTGIPLTTSTRIILTLSALLRNEFFLIGWLGMSMGTIIFYLLIKWRYPLSHDRFILKIPLCGTLIKARAQEEVCHILALLLQGGVPLSHALSLAASNMHNFKLKEEIMMVHYQVVAGKPFSAALQDTSFTTQDLHAIVAIGEETGALATLINHAAQLMQQRYLQRLTWWAAIIPVITIVTLGLCMMMLVLAMYAPLTSLLWL